MRRNLKIFRNIIIFLIIIIIIILAIWPMLTRFLINDYLGFLGLPFSVTPTEMTEIMTDILSLDQTLQNRLVKQFDLIILEISVRMGIKLVVFKYMPIVGFFFPPPLMAGIIWVILYLSDLTYRFNVLYFIKDMLINIPKGFIPYVLCYIFPSYSNKLKASIFIAKNRSSLIQYYLLIYNNDDFIHLHLWFQTVIKYNLILSTVVVFKALLTLLFMLIVLLVIIVVKESGVTGFFNENAKNTGF